MLYGGISAYIMFHCEVFEMSAYIVLPACITELALRPFGPQSSLSNPVLLLEASGNLESSGKPLGSSGERPGGVQRALGGVLIPLGALLEPSRALLDPS